MRVIEIGDDEEGQPRIIIEATREELKALPPLLYREVRIVEQHDEPRQEAK